MTVEITIKDDVVVCSCGYYDKSFDPLRLARRHNTIKHAGNLPIVDVNSQVEHAQYANLETDLISKEN